VTLSPSEIIRLHLEDGLMAASELDVGATDGFDPAEDTYFRSAVRQALQPPSSPSIVNDVMRRVGTVGVPVSDALREEAEQGSSVAGAVMSKLGVTSHSGDMVGDAIRGESASPESVWPGVAAAIGADVGVDLGSLLRGAVEEEGNHIEAGWGDVSRPRWVVPAAAGVVIAAAAALLLWVGSGGIDTPSVVEKLVEGPVDIEALEVGAASAVQVLQLGDEAPTIILIEEGTVQPEGAE
jgi:hypothetical protein